MTALMLMVRMADPSVYSRRVDQGAFGPIYYVEGCMGRVAQHIRFSPPCLLSASEGLRQ